MSSAPPAPEFEQPAGPLAATRARDLIKWQAWSPQNFALAEAQNRLIYVYLGQLHHAPSTQLANECFRDPQIAQLLNEQFVCFLVDIDEQPSVQEILGTVALALGTSPTLPMQAILAPDGAPFFVSSSLIAHGEEGRPGLFELLTRSSELFLNQVQEFRTQAQTLGEEVARRWAIPDGDAAISEDILRSSFIGIGRTFDPSFYGFGQPPKRPQVPALSFLLCYAASRSHKEAQAMALLTLGAMSSGGFYDQLGGGFFCESRDRAFATPVFEKQLGSNAELAGIYLRGYYLSGHEPLRRIVGEVLDFIIREMSSPGGGFFYRLLAESPQGDYFLWTRRQLKKAVGEPAATHCAHFYEVVEQGEIEGQSVLRARRSLALVAKELGIAEAELVTSIESSRSQLYALRLKRSGLVIDDRLITSDNARVISALSAAGAALGNDQYLEHAERAARRFWSERTAEGLLFHSLAAERQGTLQDQVHFAQALFDLHQATLNDDFLSFAQELCALILKHYTLAVAGERSVAGEQSQPSTTLLLSLQQRRAQEQRPESGPEESLSLLDCSLYPQADTNCEQLAGNLSRVLHRIAKVTGSKQYSEQAHALLAPYASYLRRTPHAACGLVRTVDELLHPALIVVVQRDTNDRSALIQAIHQSSSPCIVLSTCHLVGDEDDDFVISPHDLEEWKAKSPLLVRQQRESRSTELFRHTQSGRASPEGTSSALRRLGVKAERTISMQQSRSMPQSCSTPQLSLSRLGLGSYRIGLDKPAHAQAVKAALLKGVNVIDTSPSFALGDSQRVIGSVVAELIGKAELQRDQLFIISKLGVALGQEAESLELRRISASPPISTIALSQRAGPDTKDAASTDIAPLLHGAFSLDPEFLSEQITVSLNRLGLDHLDLCLLNSPEHLLIAGHSPDALKVALRAAFVQLEKEVSRGRIGAYGLVSNTLVATRAQLTNPIHRHPLALEEILSLASEVNPSHHFSAIESPANLIENNALADNEEGLFRFAKHHGLLTLACRPLSAVTKGALLRLTDIPPAPSGVQAKDLSSATYKVASLEAEFETTLAVQLRLTQRAGNDPILPFTGALNGLLNQMATREQFDQAESTLVTPKLSSLLAQLDRAFHDQPAYGAWKGKYIKAVGTYLACMREQAKNRSRELLVELEQRMLEGKQFRNAEAQAAWISQSWPCRAVTSLMDCPHLDIVLVGMRSPAHVAELAALLGTAPHP